MLRSLVIAILASCCALSCNSLGFLSDEDGDDERGLNLLLAAYLLAAANNQSGPEYLVATSLINGGGNGSVHLLRIADDSCLLETLDSAPAGNEPYDLIVSADGAHAYVANAGDATITNYAIDYAAARLTPGATAGVNGPATPIPYGMSIHPNGFLYAADGAASGAVAMFQRDATTGALTGLSPNDFIASANYMWYATLNATGDYLYVSHFNGFADAGNDSVYVYSVNSTTGALSFVSNTASGNQPWYVALHPTGNFVYVSNYGSASLSMYAVNPGTGALSAIGGGTVAAGTNPIGLAVGRSHVFAANSGSNSVTAYAVNAATGALSQLEEVAVGTPPPYGLALSSDGDCLYVAQTDENAGTNTDRIAIYAVSATGTLNLVDSVSAGAGPRFISITGER